MATVCPNAQILRDGYFLGGATACAAGSPLERDAELMVRVREGDDGSFSILLERYHRPVMRFLYRMIHNRAISEELAQEVFLRVYRSRATYEPKSKFNTWLFLIATRVGLNWIRDTRKENRQAIVDEKISDGVRLRLAERRPTTEQEMLHEVKLRAVRGAIEALPPRQRMIVLMHKYEELNYRQIADVLGCTESAVRSRMFRAYENLRAQLADASPSTGTAHAVN